MKILGIDFGTKRIGVALSDGLMITAQGQDSILSKSLLQDIEAIKSIITENGVTEIVVGLPISMNGTHSAKTRETLEFVENLSKAVGIPVKTWDERLTSRAADQLGAGSKGQASRDEVAAMLILQSFFDDESI